MRADNVSNMRNEREGGVIGDFQVQGISRQIESD